MQPLYKHRVNLPRASTSPPTLTLYAPSAPVKHALNPGLARAFQQSCQYWARPLAGSLSDASPRYRPNAACKYVKSKRVCIRNASTSEIRDAPPLPTKNESAQRELPSQSEHRRSPLSKRASHLMDNLQSNIFIAGQRLNDLTGYSGIETLKQDIENQGMDH